MSIMPVVAQGGAQTVQTNTATTTSSGTAAANAARETKAAKPKEADPDRTRSVETPKQVEAAFEATSAEDVGTATTEPDSELRSEREMNRLDLTA